MIKTFEELRSHVWVMRQNTLELLYETLEESTEFQRASYHGAIYGYDEVLDALRDIIKYGDVE